MLNSRTTFQQWTGEDHVDNFLLPSYTSLRFHHDCLKEKILPVYPAVVVVFVSCLYSTFDFVAR